MKNTLVTSDQLANLLRATASENPVERTKAVSQFFDFVQLPIRDAVWDGDNTGNIFARRQIPAGVSPEFPVAPIAPGQQPDFYAYTHTGKGMPSRLEVVGDVVYLPSIESRNEINWARKYARDARWDVISYFLDRLAQSFVYKRNANAWHTILKAAADRGLVVFDSAANEGQLSKRLFSLYKCAMVRNGGGNMSSVGRGRATDLFVSCEGKEEIYNWNLAEVPDSVRAQLYSQSGNDTDMLDVAGVKVHTMVEFGVGQEYQTYYTSTLSGALAPSGAGGGAHGHDDVELAIGIDAANKDSFVWADIEMLQVYDNPLLHPEGRGGAYGHECYSIGVLDNRRVVALSY